MLMFKQTEQNEQTENSDISEKSNISKKSKIPAMLNGVKILAVKLWNTKTGNTDKYKILKIVLVAVFPILLVFTTELNHTQSVFALFSRIEVF